MDEKWLPIPGHDHYEVSDHGRVRSTGRYQTIRGGKQAFFPGKVLSPAPGAKGHLHVVLNRGKTRQVHHLVLEAFVGPRPSGMLALHRDGDSANNRLSNLYWGTHSDNGHDAVRHGTHHQASKKVGKCGHPLDGVRMRPDGSVRQRYCKICNCEQVRAWKQAHRT